jgi:hypothetical protein
VYFVALGSPYYRDKKVVSVSLRFSLRRFNGRLHRNQQASAKNVRRNTTVMELFEQRQW